MEHLLELSYLSWTKLILLTAIVLAVLFIVRRFHVFSQVNWGSSIGFHVFFYIMVSLIIIAFVLVRPFIHGILVLILAGFFYRYIFSYGKTIFNLFFSGIHIGDHIQIGETNGVLDGINFGGLHIREASNQVFFPFIDWQSDRIILHSTKGESAIHLKCFDESGRNTSESVAIIEDLLFTFPYLASTKNTINVKEHYLEIIVGLSNSKFRNSLVTRLKKHGFSIVQ